MIADHDPTELGVLQGCLELASFGFQPPAEPLVDAEQVEEARHAAEPEPLDRRPAPRIGHVKQAGVVGNQLTRLHPVIILDALGAAQITARAGTETTA